MLEYLKTDFTQVRVNTERFNKMRAKLNFINVKASIWTLALVNRAKYDCFVGS
jgi:hypothetical protein